jgi:hypothetical protein
MIGEKYANLYFVERTGGDGQIVIYSDRGRMSVNLSVKGIEGVFVSKKDPFGEKDDSVSFPLNEKNEFSAEYKGLFHPLRKSDE